MRKKPFVNDGRAPDTSDILLGTVTTGSSLKIRVNKKLLKDVVCRDQAEMPVPLPKKKRGRPVGSKNIERNSLISYQSYTHLNNSCYITSVLEVLSVCLPKIQTVTLGKS